MKELFFKFQIKLADFKNLKLATGDIFSADGSYLDPPVTEILKKVVFNSVFFSFSFPDTTRFIINKTAYRYFYECLHWKVL